MPSVFLISEDTKMFSKYIQDFCTITHSSRAFDRVCKFFFIYSASARMTLTKRLPRIMLIVA